VIKQGEIWWSELPEPHGSEPGYRRPVVIVQGDACNRSRINTIICVAITSNMALQEAPGNVFLPASKSNLPKDSLANVSQIVTMDRGFLTERVSALPKNLTDLILDGINLTLGR